MIRQRRLARGWTQEQAAEEAGVSVGAWRSTEAGTRRPRPYTFSAILQVLDLSPEDLHQMSVLQPPPSDLVRSRQELASLCQDRLPDELVEPLLATLRQVTGRWSR
jgi:transcriptional regulator with XRE-family HTH domain